MLGPLSHLFLMLYLILLDESKIRANLSQSRSKPIIGTHDTCAKNKFEDALKMFAKKVYIC